MRRQRTARLIAGTASVIAALTGHALAWGSQGHHIAAEVAEHYLEPATASHIRDLLSLENAASLVDVSTWADEIRSQRPDTAPWHFVSIPIHPMRGAPAAYEPGRDCSHDNCVVAAVERFERLLADKTIAPPERLEALKFLVHLVGDIHQPLRCADDGNGHGGDVHVTFLGRHTNLQALWDQGFLDAVGVGDEHAYAARLVASIPAARVAQWRAGTPVEWANESYGIGRLIYGGSHEARAMALFYEEDFVTLVNTQLEKAGIRLAMLLNRALGAG